MALKFNPATGRYERVTADGGFEPIGPAGQPLFVPPSGTTPPPISTTTVPAGRDSKKSSGSTPSRSRPRSGSDVPPTVPSLPPQGGWTGEGMPPTVAIPTPTTTVAPRRTAPKGSTGASRGTSGRGMGGPTIKQVQAGQVVGGKGFKTEAQGLPEQAAGEDVATGAMTTNDLLALINAMGGGGGGGGSASEAAAGRAGYIGGMRAAAAQEAAALQGQKTYNDLGASLFAQQQQEIAGRYDPQMEAMKNYFANAGTAAREQISAATTAALAGLTTPSAYADLVAPNIQSPTQALDLAAYGVSPQAAQAQAATDAATAKFVSDLMTRGYQQTQAVNKDYMDALRNAVTAGGTSAQNALAQSLVGLQAQEAGAMRQARSQEESGAAAARDALLRAGLETLIGGQQTAAGTRAETEAKFGAYKPKKPKKPVRNLPKA